VTRMRGFRKKNNVIRRLRSPRLRSRFCARLKNRRPGRMNYARRRTSHRGSDQSDEWKNEGATDFSRHGRIGSQTPYHCRVCRNFSLYCRLVSENRNLPRPDRLIGDGVSDIRDGSTGTTGESAPSYRSGRLFSNRHETPIFLGL
jgi:hypothetical protein